MEASASSPRWGLLQRIAAAYGKMMLNPTYRVLVLLLGAPVHIFVYFYYWRERKSDPYLLALEDTKQELLASGYHDSLIEDIRDQQIRKHQFFQEQIEPQTLERQVAAIAASQFQAEAHEQTMARLRQHSQQRLTYAAAFQQLLESPLFVAISLVPGALMYVLILIFGSPYLKYIVERLLMSVFVIFGVAFLVFSILYISPMNPAANILGETATAEQIESFNQLYGLDQPYLVQLGNTLKGIATFDLGKSFAGNEEVTTAIAGKFPVTLTLTLISLIMAIIIALPIGIISAVKPNSVYDYTFMFIALLGLSIPSFWQGLVFILNFSIKLHWLPATYNPQNWLSIIMPTIVLGTGLTAAVARMTRSSTLEVINEDYIITAKAKGLSKRQILRKHAVGNALIPIITVIGLQFGGMLGGSAVTEKVFNISGIGSYIVDKQFIPDIPSIMGGVIYTAITISLINVVIDILYAFFDPRIRSKMKQY
ncbi:ABC transporter permease [Paenibacillus sp. ACRRX]|uniref:ABC transporter permease n=1 Tax=Paenibacillus sp. ACRRX TaxID=2918206 RepID=UPI001EF6497C|nr:ABC transporter permease [Paenibacillus sp. ACRRX]MCG7405946.1 ABC transporter permease [Paenibacillus sp. ACRRX]